VKRTGTSKPRRIPNWASLALPGLSLFPVWQLLAQPVDFEPAMIDALGGLTDMQFGPEDLGAMASLAVRCQAFVETDGSLTDSFCTSDDGIRDRSIIGRVTDQLAAETFSPARVQGSEVRVLMNFALLIACESGKCVSVPVPNHGYQIAAFGVDYVAPQPILSDEHWYDGFEDRGPRYRSPGSRPNSAGLPTGWFVAAVDVDFDGVASASCIYALDHIRTDDTRQQNRRRMESMLDELAETNYIPGFSAGAPVKMRFFESNNFRVTIGPGSRQFATAREAPELYCEP